MPNINRKRKGRKNNKESQKETAIANVNKQTTSTAIIGKPKRQRIDSQINPSVRTLKRNKAKKPKIEVENDLLSDDEGLELQVDDENQVVLMSIEHDRPRPSRNVDNSVEAVEAEGDNEDQFDKVEEVQQEIQNETNSDAEEDEDSEIKEHANQIHEIDEELKRKMQELHRLMAMKGMKKSAEQLNNCLEICNNEQLEQERIKQGTSSYLRSDKSLTNTNQNATQHR